MPILEWDGVKVVKVGEKEVPGIAKGIAKGDSHQSR